MLKRKLIQELLNLDLYAVNKKINKSKNYIVFAAVQQCNVVTSISVANIVVYVSK